MKYARLFILITIQGFPPLISAYIPLPEVAYVGSPCNGDGEPCEVCTGDCDDDSDCVGSLRCGQRSTTTGLEEVPGCVWGPGSDAIRLASDDYCFQPVTKPGKVNYVGECSSGVGGGYICKECEGDCDSSNDCEGDLICFKRTGFLSIPGCSGEGGSDIYGKDICYKPSFSPIATPDRYNYIPAVEFTNSDSSGNVTFLVQANNDGHIALGPTTQHDGIHYEIVLGGWSNGACVIRLQNQGSHVAHHAPGTLNGSEYVLFRVLWDATMLKVEHSPDQDESTLVELMKLENRHLSNYTIKHMLVSTGFGASGLWQIIDRSE